MLPRYHGFSDSAVRHSAAEFGNVHFLESVLDIHCQLLGNVGHSHRAIALSQRTPLNYVVKHLFSVLFLGKNLHLSNFSRFSISV